MISPLTIMRSAPANRFAGLVAAAFLAIAPMAMTAYAQTGQSTAPTASPLPASSLLTPENHALLLVDHQPQMAFAVASHDVVEVRNNVTALAKSATAFEVPVILTTVAEATFSGPTFPELAAALPGAQPIDRTTMNAWEDQRISDAVNGHNRPKIVIAALWTEVCGIGPVLSALDQGYDVYFVTDASGGVSIEAHDMAVERMIQAGATPITWMQYALELQRDWARVETYKAVTGIMKEHGGGYGLGIVYANEMFGAEEGQ